MFLIAENLIPHLEMVDKQKIEKRLSHIFYCLGDWVWLWTVSSWKTILIDSSGWSDLLLGVVVGALKPPHAMLMERRIPTSSFTR